MANVDYLIRPILLCYRYEVLILLITYLLPMVCMGVTYTRVGVLLWGSRGVGEQTPGQKESLKAKRKVDNTTNLS